MRLSPLGPIFGIEMVTGARRLRFFVTRGCYALLLLLVLWFNYTLVDFQLGATGSQLNIHQIAEFAGRFFYFFAFLQLAAVLLVSPATLGSLIARERERRTIEYLFATDLSNTEIVLGKFVAGWCYVGALLLVGLPILSLTMMMGGVPPVALFASFAITLSTSIFVAAIATLVSVVSRRARDGVTQTYLALLLLFLVPFFFDLWVVRPMAEFYEGPLIDAAEYAIVWVKAINPVLLLGQILMATGMPVPGGLRDPLIELCAGQLAIATLALSTAVFAVRRLHLRAAGRADQPKKLTIRLGRRPAVGDHGMLWKELYIERAPGRRGAIARIALALLVIAAIVSVILAVNMAYEDPRSLETGFKPFIITLNVVVGCAALLIVGVRASTLVSGERERDTWISLLCTPITSAEFLRAKVAGSLYAIRWIVVLLLFVWGAASLLVPSFLLALPFLAGSFAILALFAAAVGTFFSLWCRNTTRSLVATLVTAFILGGGYSWCCGCLGSPFLMMGGDRAAMELHMFLVTAPLAPFHLGFPAWIGLYGAEFDDAVMVPMAYVFGSLFYLAAALAILAHCHHRFNHLAGRISLAAPNLMPRAIGTPPPRRDGLPF